MTTGYVFVSGQQGGGVWNSPDAGSHGGAIAPLFL